MNKRSQALSLTGNLLSQVANAARGALRLFLLIGVLMGSSLGLTPLVAGGTSTEAKAPLEEIELDKEAVICLRYQTHLRRHSCSQTSLISTPQHPCSDSSANAILAPPSGHRLSNRLLAPLRC
jgi:hypothetical protein